LGGLVQFSAVRSVILVVLPFIPALSHREKGL